MNSAKSSRSGDKGQLVFMDSKNKLYRLDPNEKLKKFKNIFANLLKRDQICVTYPITSMVINYDSTKVISVQKQGEQESII